MAHPRTNGQVERINGLLLNGLKKRLYDAISKKGGKWIQELPHVIWGLRTQPSKETGQSPFFLTYGSEAILPQIQQQQQHSLFSQASWGRLEMKPERNKFKVQAH